MLVKSLTAAILIEGFLCICVYKNAMGLIRTITFSYVYFSFRLLSINLSVIFNKQVSMAAMFRRKKLMTSKEKGYLLFIYYIILFLFLSITYIYRISKSTLTKV